MPYNTTIQPKKAILREHVWYHLIQSWENKGVCTFLKDYIRLKLNVIAELEFDFSSHDIIVQHFCHYPTRTPPNYF